MAEQQEHPLQDQANWNKPKTWIVPLKVTIMVNDPTQYDEQMTKFVKNLVNELRSIATNFDKSGKQLTLTTLAPIKTAEQIEILEKGAKLKDMSNFDMEAMVKKAVEDKLNESK